MVQAGAPGAGDLLEGEWQTGPLTIVPNVPTNGERAFALSGDATTIAMAYQDAGTRVGFYDRATDATIDDIAEGDATQLTISDDASIIAYVVGQPFELQQVHLLQRGGAAALTVDDRSFDPEELRHPWLSGDGDVLRGGNGSDLLVGGSGDDELYGEAGRRPPVGRPRTRPARRRARPGFVLRQPLDRPPRRMLSRQRPMRRNPAQGRRPSAYGGEWAFRGG